MDLARHGEFRIDDAATRERECRAQSARLRARRRGGMQNRVVVSLATALVAVTVIVAVPARAQMTCTDFDSGGVCHKRGQMFGG